MRNLVVTSDITRIFAETGLGDCLKTVSIAFDFSREFMLVLMSNGSIKRFSLDSLTALDLGDYVCGVGDTEWLNVEYIDELGTAVCIACSGSITRVSEVGCDEEGVIEGGIAAVRWSPDYRHVAIATNNNSLLSMAPSWDVLQEVPMEGRVPGSQVALSWRGDGEYCAVYSVDKADGVPRVRVYNADLEVQAVGRMVGEGQASIIKGLCPVLAYSSNGGLIAVAQQKPSNKLYVVFLEKNGLKHGEFEVFTPQLPDGCTRWTIGSLHWDLPSTILAVSLIGTDENGTVFGATLLYYRDNYHWYLKQCWTGIELNCLGFDKELAGKLYLSQRDDENSLVLRIIETAWDICSSTSSDSSIAVIDGSSILLTPVGLAVVPPPMSMFQIALPSPARHVIYTTADSNSCAWMLTCLCTGFHVQVYIGGDKAAPNLYVDCDLCKVLSAIPCFQRQTLVSALAIESNGNIVLSVISGSYYENEQLLTAVHIIEIDYSKETRLRKTVHLPGIINRVVSPISKEPFLFVGLINTPDTTELHKISLDTEEKAVRVGTLPDTCSSILLASSAKNDDPLIFGISKKNKLYFGELLMKSGVNSVAINSSIGVVLYATVGTRPHLHFCSLDAISALDPLQFENNAPLPIEIAAPRPLERGAKIVASVSNQPKVIIQLPRGNLEGFEPRALVLAHASRLLDIGEYFRCLVLLRRQKVDLNFLVDYNPANFIDNSNFVSEALELNNDILSLLISSLEDYDTTVTKYVMPGMTAVKSYPKEFLTKGKVNTVCEVIRQALNPLVSTKNSALHPMLCTYAKQRPPLLLDALMLIRSLGQENSFASIKVHGALKYMAFLAEGDRLFDAALESCDFDMSRTVAKICQMDPKMYIPLVESFESIQKIGETLGSEEAKSIYSRVMRFKIFVHLKRFRDAVLSGISALAICAEICTKDTEYLKQTVENVMVDNEIDSVGKVIAKIVSENDIFAIVLPEIRRVVVKSSKFKNKFFLILNTLLSQLQLAFGYKCIEKLAFSEAVSVFLSMNPPNRVEAVRAARMMGDWTTALSIAGRGQEEGIDVRKLVQELVSDCRESLEQGESFDDDYGMSIAIPPPSNTEAEVSLFSDKIENRALYSARLCLDYLEDTESAVAILLAARKWIDAINVAILKKRYDLLREDIASSCTDTAKQTLRMLKRRSTRHLEILSELKVLWVDPDQRLQQVSSTETALSACLRGESLTAIDDSKSDFTADSRYSHSSYVSNFSSFSTASDSSGTSSVSILSGASSQSKLSQAFSVEGLDHSLLSRGKEVRKPHNDEDTSAKKAVKKKHKSTREKRGEGRTEAKDIWGLRRELNLCDDLMRLTNIADIVETVRDICDALIFLSGEDCGSSIPEKCQLASDLQNAMDQYISQLQEDQIPYAPSYPFEWLEKRSLTSICYFQKATDIKFTKLSGYTTLILRGGK